MRLSLLSAVLAASTALAQVPIHVGRVLLAQPAPQSPPPSVSSPSDDDEDEDEAGPSSAPGSSDAPAAAAPVPPSGISPAADAPTQTTTAEQQRLISGAPLYNPNVAVHIVERKAFSDRLRHEFVLYPASAQLNGKFTQHFGSAFSYLFHLHENFGFQVSPFYNWSTSEAGFNKELVNKVREEAQSATALLLVWGVHAGVEVSPIYGKFAFYDGSLGHFALIINGGAGVGSTKRELKPASQATGAATYGDTGYKFLGEVGAGFRLQLGKRFTFRFEVRDLVYSARVDSVNGCNLEDLSALRTNPNANVGQGCNVSAFDLEQGSTDLAIATDYVRDPSSDVLNNVGGYLGFGIIF
jgi:outer membrane beta-barrel protein